MRGFYNGLAFEESEPGKGHLVQKNEISAAERNWKSWKPHLKNHLCKFPTPFICGCWFLVLSRIIALSIPFLSFCSSWVWCTGRDRLFTYVCGVCVRHLCMGRTYPGISEIPKSVTNILKFRFHMYYKPATWKRLFSLIHYSHAFSNPHPLEKNCWRVFLYILRVHFDGSSKTEWWNWLV